MIDLLQYMRGDGRVYTLHYNWAGGGEQLVQTQVDSAYPNIFYHVKDGEWECLYYSPLYICREADISEAPDKYYVQTTSGRSGARWARRFQEVGTITRRGPTVVHYWQETCEERARGLHETDLVLLEIKPSHTFPSGITLNDVIILAWIVGGTQHELYYYALNYGLVGWEKPPEGMCSYIQSEHPSHPGLVRHVVSCLPDSRLEDLYYPEDVFDIVDALPKYPDPDHRYITRDLDGLEAHVVHHTTGDCSVTPEGVARHHTLTRGWPGIGYTFFISCDGTIYLVNYLETKSAGVKYHNNIYLSTALVGEFLEGRTPTAMQLAALNWLHDVHIPALLGRKLPILGHKECLDALTECPGDSWDWRAAVGEEEEQSMAVLLNPSFEDKWTDIQLGAEYGFLKNQKPMHWALAWAWPGESLPHAPHDIATNVPECRHLLNEQLPDNEKVGAENALITDGLRSYKIFVGVGGGSFAGMLRQHIYGLKVGTLASLLADVQIHYHPKGEYFDPYGAEFYLGLNNAHVWVPYGVTGDRKWYEAYIQVLVPPSGVVTAKLIAKCKWKARIDIIIDNLRFEGIAADGVTPPPPERPVVTISYNPDEVEVVNDIQS